MTRRDHMLRGRGLSVIEEKLTEQETEEFDILSQTKQELTQVKIQLDKMPSELEMLTTQLESMDSIVKKLTIQFEKLQTQKESAEEKQQTIQQKITDLDKEIDSLTGIFTATGIEIELLKKSLAEKEQESKTIFTKRESLFQEKKGALETKAEDNQTLKIINTTLYKAKEELESHQFVVNTLTLQKTQKQDDLEGLQEKHAELALEIQKIELQQEIQKNEKEKENIIAAAKALEEQRNKKIKLLKEQLNEIKSPPMSTGTAMAMAAAMPLDSPTSPRSPRLFRNKPLPLPPTTPPLHNTASIEAIEWVKENQGKVFDAISSHQDIEKDLLHSLVLVYNLMSESKLNINEKPLQRKNPNKNPDITEIIKSLATAKQQFAESKASMSQKNSTKLSLSSIFKHPSYTIIPLLEVLLASLSKEFPTQIAAHNEQYSVKF